jgi:hypothetical protein
MTRRLCALLCETLPRADMGLNPIRPWCYLTSCKRALDVCVPELLVILVRCHAGCASAPRTSEPHRPRSVSSAIGIGTGLLLRGGCKPLGQSTSVSRDSIAPESCGHASSISYQSSTRVLSGGCKKPSAAASTLLTTLQVSVLRRVSPVLIASSTALRAD